MVKKSKVLLTQKYDIANKVLNELANLESRHILFSIIKHPKSVQEISNEERIPLSSAYHKIISLKECALIDEKTDFSDDGRITKYYQSKVKDIEISMTKFEPTITFTKNNLIKND